MSKTGEVTLPIQNKSANESPKNIRPVTSAAIVRASKGLPPTSAEGELLSMSLVDECANQLIEQMKSIKGHEYTEIKAACLCASEISKLVKLKLEAARLMHKIGEDNK